MTWQPTKLTRIQLEERRLAGGRLLKQGRLSQAQIAQRLGVSRTAVSQWAQQMDTGGLPQLYQRISTGRPAQLTPGQQQELVRQLKRGALAAGFSTDRWTLQRIQQLIRREFQVTYHPNYLSRLLRKLGWTPQYPLPRAKECDDELVETWLRHDWPRIKKAGRIGAEIVLFDETGFSFLAPSGRTWAPRGERPLLRRVTKERRVLSTAVGLTISGKIFKRHFERAMRGEEVIAALEHLRPIFQAAGS